MPKKSLMEKVVDKISLTKKSDMSDMQDVLGILCFE
jgi:hypothetical protein